MLKPFDVSVRLPLPLLTFGVNNVFVTLALPFTVNTFVAGLNVKFALASKLSLVLN